ICYINTPNVTITTFLYNSLNFLFFFSSRRRHTSWPRDWSSDVCSSDLFFEISARCNLRCQMCAINYDGRYKPSAHRRAFFEPDLFAKLRPIFPTLYRASLFGLGEPMLN